METPPREENSFLRPAAAIPFLVMAAAAAVALHGLWHGALWTPFEPRVIEIAREQFAGGNILRVPTFSGMPFLEKPPLYYDLVALSFFLTGGPSVMAARAVTAAMALAWCGAAAWAAGRAGGLRAAALAAGLLAAAPNFFRLARRVELDTSLAAFLTLGLLFLAMALDGDDKKVRKGPFLLCLAAVGCAALSKGLFATFLFLAPAAAYTLLARDWRILAALVRPSSILLLLAPHLLYGLDLYLHGGMTFVGEHFVNNSLGRFLHIRFDIAGSADLPYGDVNEPSEWYYYLYKIPSIAGAALLAVPFAARRLAKDRFRKRDRRSTLIALGLSFGIVPPLILSFSSQKGIHHLGICASGFAVAAAVWLEERLEGLKKEKRTGPGPRPILAFFAVIILAVAAPLAVVAGLLGLPATAAGAATASGAMGVVGLAGCLGALFRKRFDLAAYGLCALFAVLVILDFSPGNTVKDDARRSVGDLTAWVASEVGVDPTGAFAFGDSDLGALAFALERPVETLGGAARVAAFLERKGAAFCVVCNEDATGPLETLVKRGAAFRVARRQSRRTTYTLYANRAGRDAFRRRAETQKKQGLPDDRIERPPPNCR